MSRRVSDVPEFAGILYETLKREDGTFKTCSLYRGDMQLKRKRLDSLSGCPRILQGSLYAAHNKLTSLKGIPREVYGPLVSLSNHPAPVPESATVDLSYNLLTSLKDVHHQLKIVHGELDVSGNLITDNVLGLLMIDGVTRV